MTQPGHDASNLWDSNGVEKPGSPAHNLGMLGRLFETSCETITRRTSIKACWHLTVALLMVMTCVFDEQGNAQAVGRTDLGAQLLQAANQGDINTVHSLLKEGANIDVKDQRGSTPLIIASEHGDAAMLKLLLASSANPSIRNKYEETALTVAARSFNPDITELLLEKTPDTKEKNESLLVAAHGGPAIREIIDAGAAPKLAEDQASPPPELPWVKIVRLLVESGADLETRDAEGDTPLMQAASYGQTETFKFLLARGARINVREKRGMTPLIAAACACAVATMNSTYDIMKILVEKGANVNARAHDGTTSLMLAAGSPDGAPTVKLLLSRGADPMAKDNQGRTAMTFAKGSPFPEKIRLLKKAMAKLN
jgi:ankyrin repeat protein